MGEFKSNFSLGDHVSYRGSQSGRIIQICFGPHAWKPESVVRYHILPDGLAEYTDKISELDGVTLFVIPQEEAIT